MAYVYEVVCVHENSMIVFDVESGTHKCVDCQRECDEFQARVLDHQFDSMLPVDFMTRRQQLDFVKVLAKDQSWRSAIEQAIAEIGSSPYLRFLVSRAKHAARLEWQKFQSRQAKHRAQQSWWHAGGRMETYFKNHGRFGGHHAFLNSALYKETGMLIREERGTTWTCNYDVGVQPRRIPKLRRDISNILIGPRNDTYVKLSTKIENLKNDKLQILIKLLRLKIQYLQESRKSKSKVLVKPMSYEKYISKLIKPYIARHEAGEEDAHGDSENVVVDQASNVALQRQTEESKAIPDSVPVGLSTCLASNDMDDQKDSLMDRFLHLTTFEWSTEATAGSELYWCDLPFQLVQNRDQSPNMALFKLYQYWEGDMEIKIQLNSNPFQVGQLQASWRYMDIYNKDVQWYENLSSLSQTDHVLLSANSNNAAVLSIPYRNIKSFLSTTTRSDQQCALNLGRLRVRVLNRLFAVSTSYHAVDVSIWVRFTRGRFVGMKSADVGKIEHEGLFDDIKQAEFHLNLDAKFNNTDKPPVQGASQMFVPHSNQSFCGGTNLTEPIQSLRLDMRGQCQNIEKFSDEMKVQYLCRKFSYIKTIRWSNDNKTQSLLTSIDASPMFNLNEYNGGVVGGDYHYNLPPVAIVSEMFLYWRGTLELRLDIIASNFHKGKLMVAYIPRYIDSITYVQALGCPHVIFDLQENKQFSYIVPWMTNQHYWPRRFGYKDMTDDVKPPGKVVIFIQNRLVPMDAVSSEIDINIYWRGGEDFSVAVPAQSALSLPWNNAPDKSDTKIVAKPTYYPYYAGQWRYFGDESRPILRYGPVMDHIAQFINMKVDGTVYYKAPDSYKLTANIKQENGDYELRVLKYGVGVADGEYRYMALAETAEQAIAYCNKIVSKDAKPWTELPVISSDDKGNYQGADNQSWTGITIVKAKHNAGEKDEDPEVQVNTTTIGTHYTGQETFGENFTDLKDLCRRYYVYGISRYTANNTLYNGQVVVPLRPQGLVYGQIDYSSMFARYCRESPIALIASGYQFFRGGLRFRFVSDLNSVDLWVQHHPEMQREPIIRNITTGTAEAVFQHGYAYLIQSTTVNNVISFEVPFYVPGNSIPAFNVKPIDKSYKASSEINGFSDLGSLIIGADQLMSRNTYDKQRSFDIMMYYSLSDDAMFSCFQGFPSMILKERTYIGSRHEGWLNLIPEKMDVSVSHNFDQLFSSAPVKNFQDTIKSFGKDISITFLTELVHVALNPKPATIVWAIASLLINIGIIKIDYMGTLRDLITKLVHIFYIICPSLGISSESDTGNRDHQQVRHEASEEEDLIKIVGGLFSLVATVCMVTDFKRPPGNIGGYVKALFKGVGQNARSFNNVFVMITNLVGVFKRIYNYFAIWQNENTILEKLINDDMPLLKDWTCEAMTLVDISNEEKILTRGSVWADRLELNFMLGSRIFKAFSDYTGTKLDTRLFASFNTIFKKICEKRENMYRRGMSAVSRIDPFCTYFVGPAGVGKSVLAADYVMALLEHAHIPYTGEPIFTLPSGAKYWNGCRNQPCVLIDDFLAVKQGTILEESIRALFEIKSCAVLNPPMAAIEDKELRYAPDMCVILSNHAFPTVNHSDLNAVFRRRDFLVQVELADVLTEAGVVRISEFTRDELLEVFQIDTRLVQHLKFRVAGDVVGGDLHNDDGAQWGRWMDYNQFLTHARRTFLAHRNNQLELYTLKRQRFDQFLDQDIQEPEELREKLNEYRQILRMLTILEPKTNCSMAEYFKLVQLAAVGGPVTDEKLRDLIEIRDNTIERMRRAQQENANHEGLVFDKDRSMLLYDLVAGLAYCKKNIIFWRGDKLKGKQLDITSCENLCRYLTNYFSKKLNIPRHQLLSATTYFMSMRMHYSKEVVARFLNSTKDFNRVSYLNLFQKRMIKLSNKYVDTKVFSLDCYEAFISQVFFDKSCKRHSLNLLLAAGTTDSYLKAIDILLDKDDAYKQKMIMGMEEMTEVIRRFERLKGEHDSQVPPKNESRYEPVYEETWDEESDLSYLSESEDDSFDTASSCFDDFFEEEPNIFVGRNTETDEHVTFVVDAVKQVLNRFAGNDALFKSVIDTLISDRLDHPDDRIKLFLLINQTQVVLQRHIEHDGDTLKAYMKNLHIWDSHNEAWYLVLGTLLNMISVDSEAFASMFRKDGVCYCPNLTEFEMTVSNISMAVKTAWPYLEDVLLGRKFSDIYKPRAEFCCHSLWTPFSEFVVATQPKDPTDVKFWKCYDPFSKRFLYIPDRACKEGEVGYNTCIWKQKSYYNFMMRSFRKFNSTKYLLFDKKRKVGKSTEIPSFMCTGAESVDYSFWYKLKVCLGSVFQYWREILNAVVTILLILLALYELLMGLIAIISWIYSLFFGGISAAGAGLAGAASFVYHNSNYSANTPKPSASKFSFPKFFSRHESGLTEDLIVKLSKNVYFVRDPLERVLFRIIALGDQKFIFLKHYYEYFKAKGIKTINVFRYNDKNFKLTFNLDDIKFDFVPECSTGIAEFPTSFPSQCHIFKRFRQQSQHHNSLNNVLFVEITTDNIIMRPVNPKLRKGLVIEANDTMSEQCLQSVYEYDVAGMGKCGSFLIDADRGHILGLHVAGAPPIGFSEILFMESFKDLYRRPFTISEDLDHVIKSDVELPFDGSFETVGIIDNGLGHHNSGETQIQPTLISPVYPIKTEPAPLKKGDPRVPIPNYSPLFSGVGNMFSPPLDFSDDLLDPAIECLQNHLIVDCKPQRDKVGVLTYNEVIVGIPNLKYYDGLDLTTSEGFPLSRFRPKGHDSKRWLFEIRELDGIRQLVGWRKELGLLIRRENSNRSNGILNKIIHDDCLKDARIACKKISQPGKTRIFSTSPVQFTIVFKQYFSDFIAAFKFNRLKLNHAVGINCNSHEWSNVVRKLCESGNTAIITGDYKNFGPSLNSKCVYAVFKIIIEWYYFYESQQNGIIAKHRKDFRWQIAKELIHAYHLCNRFVYRTLCGCPSGSPATVEINCLVNELYVMCAFQYLGKQQNFRYFLDHYYIHVRLIVYGDDLIMSVSDEIKEWFNNLTMSTFFQNYGIGYTDSSKTGVERPYQNLYESDFLKRSFRPHPYHTGEFLAPLDWDSVTDTANWCHSYLSLEDGTVCSAVDSVTQAYGHGPKVFSEHREKISQALLAKGLRFSIRTWNEWDMINFPEYYT